MPPALVEMLPPIVARRAAAEIQREHQAGALGLLLRPLQRDPGLYAHGAAGDIDVLDAVIASIDRMMSDSPRAVVP